MHEIERILVCRSTNVYVQGTSLRSTNRLVLCPVEVTIKIKIKSERVEIKMALFFKEKYHYDLFDVLRS